MKKISGLLLFVILSLLPLRAQTLTSQSVTVLPSGQTLLLGGYDRAGKPVADVWLANPSATPQKLSVTLNVARAGHSATVLPDGKVLIFGGFGQNGQLVPSAESEIYDPVTQQFSIASDVVAVPRALHTATVLSDGTIFLAGGIEAGGAFSDDIQLLDFHTHKALSEHAMLVYPRQGHTATLLADGSVRLSGGMDKLGHSVTTDEYYDPVTMRFHQSAASGADDAEPPAIAASIPANGAVGVSIQAMIAMRFTSVLSVVTVTSANFVLTDTASNTIPAKVTAVEGGRLVFVIPANPLQPGTSYTLTIGGSASGTNGNQVSAAAISFTTEGTPPESDGPDWTPGPGWKSDTQTLAYKQLPPLQAGHGVTALAGQVLKLSGYPLPNVTIEINGKKTRTDHTGRFLLENIPSGRQVIWIDASTANTGNATYGTYELGEDIVAGKTTVLNYTIWMTQLDTAHAVNIPSPTTQETVITNPAMPGFELRLPVNSVIVDRYGKTVHQITITPVPLNKPPFPLPPRVDVEIYFTIQPGGAYIRVGKDWTKGGRLIYPNSDHLKPGTMVTFFNYDAEVKGWYIYGAGHVSANAQSVVPDPGVEIYRFTGAMTGSKPKPPGASCTYAPNNPNPSTGGDPINLSTGEFFETVTDLKLPDVIPIELSRTYISNNYFSGSFGVGSTDNFDMYLIGDMFPYTYQELIVPDGSRIRFDRISSGTSWTDAVYAATSSQCDYYGSRLTWDSTAGDWLLTLKDGTRISFPEASGATNGFCQAPTQIVDRYGNTVTLTRTANARNSPTGCNLTQIKSPNGRYINLTHDSSGRITQAQDNAGRTVTYTYTSAGELQTVTDPNGGVTTYGYNTLHQMTTVIDPRGNVTMTNQYDSSNLGLVLQQTLADGSTWLFNGWPGDLAVAGGDFFSDAGSSDADAPIVASGCWGANGFNRYNSSCLEGYTTLASSNTVTITDPRGYVRKLSFGPTGSIMSDTHAVGQPEEQTTTYTYYSDNLIQSKTDALGRTTTYDYDANGNLTTMTRLAGTANAVTTSYAYEPRFNQLSSVTDPLGHITSFSYDPFGNLTTITDPLNHQTTISYDDSGRMIASSDALGNTTHFAYSGADLSTVTDPIGNISASFSDSAGRLISRVDPIGNVSQIQYNNLSLVSQATDPQGNNTSFTYDANGNLLTLTDALSHTISYGYDTMNRKVNHTDALNRSESFTYDLNGNLVSTIDRKGQVTVFSYDGLDQLKQIGYGATFGGGSPTYQSTISYTFDAGNRITQSVDSIAGTITDSYDGLDRLTGETTSQGTVSYGYDAASRRTSFQVTGQTALGYAYDNANRLIQIAQGSSVWAFGYDIANRRTSLTLPGGSGVTVSYGYDNDSRITSIMYQYGSITLGNLTYGYDQDSRSAQVGGSFARTGLPGSVSSTTFDAANELANWNGISISYSANGNMLSDGSNAFTWDARNHISTINGISLQYDAFGRRTENLFGTSLLYDRANAVQELSGSTVTANSIMGGMDEVFNRSDSSGTFTPLRDALGSTIALVDNSGNIHIAYSYDPFGNTSFSGSTDTNPSQYTGRENEQNGLYYYRARYYSPELGRFISEDPLGFAGSGLNYYSYLFDSPMNSVDPTGLFQYKPKIGNLNDGEIDLDVANVGWADSIEGYSLAQQALQSAQAWGRQHDMNEDEVHNGSPDAFRHCFWSCTMARSIGETSAEYIAYQHEMTGNAHGQPWNEYAMDSANNMVGRACAKDTDHNKDCALLCEERYEGGRLFGLGGRPITPDPADPAIPKQ